jgi:ABC-type molybdenum transport system ATPase subunit/photorepair protein PhrA
MILLARAIAQRPRLLLLDGTLDGLEAAEIDRIVAHIAGPERPWTLVVVTRDPDVIRHFPERLTLPGLPAHGGSGGSGHDSHGH